MTSHPSPFYRQRQSTKTLDPTGQTAKFLYTILKQLDLKNIDWNEVARNLDITNGHAARMRWSRFRAQIEGLDNSYSRKGGRKKDTEKKRRKENQSTANEKPDTHYGEDVGLKRLKAESMPGMRAEDYESIAVGAHYGNVDMVKHEPFERNSVINGVTVHHPTITTVHMPWTHDSRNRYTPDPAQQLFPHNNSTSHATLPNQDTLSESCSKDAARQPMSQWPQQSFGPIYQHSVHRSTNTLSPFHSGPGAYPTQRVYPNAYMNQLQQRYPYNQQQVYNNLQQHQKPQQPQQRRRSNDYNIAHVKVPSTLVNTTANHTQLSQSPSHSTCLDMAPLFPSSPTQSSSNGPAPSQQSTTTALQPQEYASELASQASYPWPYSESSLPRFIQQARQSPKLDNNASGKFNEGSTFGTESSELCTPNIGSTILSQPKAKNQDEGAVGHTAIARTSAAANVGSDLSLGQEASFVAPGGQNNAEMGKSNMARREQGPSQGPYIKSEPEVVLL